MARLPVYLILEGREVVRLWPLLVLSTLCVVIGTLVGTRLLRRIDERVFRRAVAILLFVLGLHMLLAGGTS